MNGNYEKWLKKEKEWVDEAEKKCKQDTLKYCLLALVGCVVVLGAIGLFAAGIDVQAMLRNMLIGFVVGIIMVLFIVMMTMPTWPAKRYMKLLKVQVEDVLSSEEREEFAAQMLGSDMKRVSWIGEEKTEEKVLITKDYALRVTGRGGAVMVQLQKVKRVEVDVKDYTVTTRGNGFKMEQTLTVYPMRFYYQQLSENNKGKCDKEFTFSRREDREKVSHILNEMKIGEQSL
ncbi:MAG: DUF2207 domain-containing protein [Lachnospiraceae bacterium]|nr:DUF2207 domain-containing protein [Lachnospiraceae bacterium]